jgi:hypothetical protein
VAGRFVCRTQERKISPAGELAGKSPPALKRSICETKEAKARIYSDVHRWKPMGNIQFHLRSSLQRLLQRYSRLESGFSFPGRLGPPDPAKRPKKGAKNNRIFFFFFLDLLCGRVK